MKSTFLDADFAPVFLHPPGAGAGAFRSGVPVLQGSGMASLALMELPAPIHAKATWARRRMPLGMVAARCLVTQGIPSGIFYGIL